QEHQRAGGQHRRVDQAEGRAGGYPGENRNEHDCLAEPDCPQESPQIDRLLVHPAPSWVLDSSPTRASEVRNDTSDCLQTVSAAAKISCVRKAVPGVATPRPISVTDGTRRPRPGAYHPSIGSVEPRCRLQS